MLYTMALYGERQITGFYCGTANKRRRTAKPMYGVRFSDFVNGRPGIVLKRVPRPSAAYMKLAVACAIAQLPVPRLECGEGGGFAESHFLGTDLDKRAVALVRLLERAGVRIQWGKKPRQVAVIPLEDAWYWRNDIVTWVGGSPQGAIVAKMVKLMHGVYSLVLQCM
jgi:hypothetical protein